VHFRAALKISPNYVYALNNLGVALEKQGNAESALKYYQKALEVRPDYAPAQKNIERLQKQTGAAG